MPTHQERCPSGLRSTPGKRVYVNSISRVRIPLSPPPCALTGFGRQATQDQRDWVARATVRPLVAGVPHEAPRERSGAGCVYALCLFSRVIKWQYLRWL
jgi:hypothetical protein